MVDVTRPGGAATRIVIVEDNPVTRKVLRVTLETGGYQVSEAAEGQAGFALIESTRPDLVLVDYVLPDMTGGELCERIRRTPHGRNLPVVLLSGHAGSVDSRSSAFDAQLLKPFEPSRLLAQIKAVLTRQSVPATPPARERSSFQSAALSLMSAMSEVLSRPAEGAAVVGDVLVHCLDAFGVASGVLYLRSAGGELRFHSQAGLSSLARERAAAVFGAPEVLGRLSAEPRTLLAGFCDPAEERFLRGLGHEAALLIPFVILGQSRGTLILGSDQETLKASEWQTFARALGSQLGQVVALGQAVSDARQFDVLIREAIGASPGGFLMVDARGTIVLANPMVEQIFGYTEAELKGQPVELLIPVPLRSQHVNDRNAFLGKPVKRQMGVGRELHGRHKSGRRVPVEIGLAPVARGDQRFVIATIIDITERLRAEEVSRRTAQTLAAAQQLAHLGSYEFDPATGEGAISEELYRIYGRTPAGPARFPSILLEFVHPEDIPRVRSTILELLAGVYVETPEIYRIVRPDGEIRWVEANRRLEKDAAGRLTRIFGAVLDITEHKVAEGELGDARHRLGALSRRLLDIQESERRQLARELHDEIGQALTAAQLNLQSIARFPDEARLAERLHEAGATIERALTQVRSLTLQLRPPLIDELGLAAALRWLVERFNRAGGPRFELGEAALPTRPAASSEIACFRIAQEAMSNVVRHANASHVQVDIGIDGGSLRLRVTDDGRGFNVAESVKHAVQGTSLGLLGMEERARLAGGTVTWRSEPGKRTEVLAVFPLEMS